jgi:SAM-dependent methyltransferase
MSYDNYLEWKDWGKDGFGSYDAGEELFYQFEIGRRVVGSDNDLPSVLEIGFGNGSFLGWARNRKYRVTGIEVQDELKNRATKHGFDIVGNIEEMSPSCLDAVVALDVFEHIPYPALIEVCKSILVALKPGGYLIARFPNGDSPFSLPIQNADATHVHALGAGIVYELMRSTGFVVEELRAPVETPVKLLSKMALPLKKLLRSLFSTYVRFAFLGKSTPVAFTINYMLIARKPR